MKNDEAKFILSAYRPAGDDASDARFGEALAQAERDPELAAWFEDARRFDSAIAEALTTIPIPSDLRTNILAGGKISRPHFWQTRRTVLALAAGIVLLAALAGVWMRGQSQLDQWQRDALAVVPTMLTGETRFDFENKDVAVLQQWLQAQNAPAPSALPVALQALPTLGCKTINSHGHAVSIICFKMRTGELIHLAVTDQAKVARPLAAQPSFAEEDGWRTASWSASGRAYMLATKAPEAELHAILAHIAQTHLFQQDTI